MEPGAEELRQPRECHLFLDPDRPEAPAVLHFPLVNDTFRSHSAPGEPGVLAFAPSALPRPAFRPAPPVSPAHSWNTATPRL